VLSNFDIIASAGAANKANIQEFNATPNSGQIAIQYVTVTDNAKSSGIELLLPAPVAPAGLLATAGDSQVALKWNTVIGVTGYNVKRSLAAAGPYTALASGVVSTNYTDSTATNGTTYYYVVSSMRSGCESTNSAAANATPVLSVLPPVSLTIHWSGSNFTVGWPTGTLQSASDLMGPWSDIGQTSSPSNMTVAPGGAQQFFRVKVK
jgi:hypothetical protein